MMACDSTACVERFSDNAEPIKELYRLAMRRLPQEKGGSVWVYYYDTSEKLNHALDLFATLGYEILSVHTFTGSQLA